MDWWIGCFTLPWSAVSFERALEGIRAAGYARVGLGFEHEGTSVPSLGEGKYGVQEVQIKLTAAGLVPVMMYANWKGDDGLDNFRTRIDQADSLGIPFVMTTGTWTGMEGKVTEEEAGASEAQFLARMSQLAPYAGEKGITLLLKPHTGNTAHGPALQATLSKIGSRWVRACYDPGNVHFYEGLTPEVDILHVVSVLSALCVKDHRGGRGERNFPVPGEGEVDFRRIFRALKRHRFSGPLMVERFDGREDRERMPVEEIDERARKAFAFLDRAVNQVKEEPR